MTVIARRHAAAELARLPTALKELRPSSYPVTIAPALETLAAEVDRRIAAAQLGRP